jgi:ABC-type uncharacterized transport system ATPase subunit
VIQVDRLTKSYGPVTAVHDVSFNVDKGQIVGFLGPNGAGKSTTMKILACFMAASGGTAKVAGFDVFTESSRSAGASATFPRTRRSTPTFRWPRIWISWPRPRAYRAECAGPRSPT